MAKPKKVVPIAEDKRQVIAKDPKTKRFIMSLGNQRIAFDFLTQITHLAPQTGDQPAPVVSMKKKRK